MALRILDLMSVNRKASRGVVRSPRESSQNMLPDVYFTSGSERQSGILVSRKVSRGHAGGPGTVTVAIEGGPTGRESTNDADERESQC